MKLLTHTLTTLTLLLTASCSLLSADQDNPGHASPADQNAQEAAIDHASLTIDRREALEDGQVQLLTCAPDGRWASASTSGVRIYASNGEKLHDARARHLSAGALDFTSEGDALYLGVGLFDAAAGEYRAQAPVADLAAWATAQGVEAPDALNIQAARYSAKGEALVVYANTTSRSRRGGQRRGAGDPDWLFLLDGRDRAPRQILFHGRGRVTHIALDEELIIAAGDGIKLFDAKSGEALATLIDAQSTTSLALSKEFLAATTASHLTVWHRGQWRAPAARVPVGEGYGSALAFHPHKPLLATGNRDQQVRLFAIQALLEGQTKPLDAIDIGGVVNALSFDSGGGLRAAVGAPGKGVTLLKISVP